MGERSVGWDWSVAWRPASLLSVYARTVGRTVLGLDRLLTSFRVRVYAALVLGCNVVAYVLALLIKGNPPYDGFGHPIAVDFVNRFTAGRFAVSGDIHWIYSVPRQMAVQHQFLGSAHPEDFAPFISPATVAYLYAPFAMVPYLVAAALWICLSVALLLVSFYLLWPLVPALHRHGVGVALLVVISSWPVIEMVFDGQDSAISLLLLVSGLRLLLARRDVTAGAILGLGAFKPQVFLLMPVLLLVQRRWPALAGWTMTTVILFATSALLVGPEGVHSYVALLTSDTLREGISNLNWKMESLVALARAVLGGPLAFLDVPATVAIGLAVLALFIRTARRPSRDARDFILLYALAVVGGVVASPYLFVYDCTILILPAFILLNEAPRTPFIRLSLVAVYLLVWSGPLRFVIFGNTHWPFSTLAGPWAALPIVILALVIYRRIQATRPIDRAVGRHGAVENLMR